MIIKSSEYSLSSVNPKTNPPMILPEIAMAGRSNVGKSSLINKVINRKNLARTSQQPGKTQTINYYLINKEFYFVDLPGYGYAKVSQSVRDTWSSWIKNYIRSGPNLKGVIQLIDIRHAPSAHDVQMYKHIMDSDIPLLLVATKLDKISKGQAAKQLKIIKNELKLSAAQPVVPFSSQTGEGKETVLEFVEDCLGQSIG